MLVGGADFDCVFLPSLAQLDGLEMEGHRVSLIDWLPWIPLISLLHMMALIPPLRDLDSNSYIIPLLPPLDSNSYIIPLLPSKKYVRTIEATTRHDEPHAIQFKYVDAIQSQYMQVIDRLTSEIYIHA